MILQHSKEDQYQYHNLVQDQEKWDTHALHSGKVYVTGTFSFYWKKHVHVQ